MSDNSTHKPPRILLLLLRWLAGNPYAQPLLGDFQEIYNYDRSRHGRARAILRLLWQMIRSLPVFIIHQINWSLTMFKNYLRIALRNLMKQKIYSAINVVGLATGMACCVLILLFIRQEISYDRFHEKGDRIYRLTLGTNVGIEQPTNANTSYMQGIAMQNEYPEIEAVVRLRKMGWGEQRVFAYEDRRFYEQHFFFADANLFQIFDFPLLEGDPATVLSEPYQLAISQSMAEKYFGDSPAIGKIISADPYNEGNFNDYRVSGVFEDVPDNSHITFDFLASFSSQTDDIDRLAWSLESVYTYILLKPGADWQAINAQLPAFIERHRGERKWYELFLQPLFDIHLFSQLRAEPTPPGDIAYVYTFSAIAIFILLLACINFMNLATAQSSRRAREVGVRKLLGAYRGQLIKQFLGEALLLSFFAAAAAILLLQLLLPLLNRLLESELTFSLIDNWEILAGVVLLALLTGIIAGSYPAFVLSAFRPAETIKSSRMTPRTWPVRLRKGLVVFQFSISMVLLICTLIVSQQMDFVRSKNLGFDREQILVSPLNDQIRQHLAGFKANVTGSPAIEAMTLTEQVPARAGNGAGYRFDGAEDGMGLTRLFVDHDFGKTYGLKMIAGRDFSEEFSTDSSAAFIINKALVQTLGKENPTAAIGMPIQMRHAGKRHNGTIVGVVDDFHLFSFRAALQPVVMNIMPLNKLNFISFRINSESTTTALADLKTAWQQFSPDYPFDYYFLDHDFARLHAADQRLGQVFQYFSILAIFVACLGLLGLAAFTAEQRTREIGVRKVLGASSRQIMVLLSNELTRWVLIANLLAWPLGYWLMTGWLQDFQHRIALGWSAFVIASLITFAIALLTISMQTLRAVMTNPVEALRYE